MTRRPLVLISLLLAAFVINLDTTIVNVALPALVRQLHASDSQLQWVVDAFNLLFAGSVLAVGSLSDRFGRKGMLLAGLSVFGLSTGVRLLPVASCVAISSILGAKLAVRVGTKLVVASGLVSMAAFYVWVASSEVTTSYGTVAAQMVLLGTGIGLTSAPATEAIMGVVPKAKAGVGSAVNDATRLLGGTLGVAVIGSVYASLYASRLANALPATLPSTIARTAHGSVGAAFTAASKLLNTGHPALAGAIHIAASKTAKPPPAPPPPPHRAPPRSHGA